MALAGTSLAASRIVQDSARLGGVTFTTDRDGKQVRTTVPLAATAIAAVTPDMYGGNTNAWQLKRHAEIMKKVAKGDAKVVFIGDSITHFWETNGRAVWNRHLACAPYCALNLGYASDSTQHVLWRISEGGELDGYEAKCVVVMIGTNNSGAYPFRQPLGDTVLGIREVLRVVRAKQPKAKVVLQPLFPRGASPDDHFRRRTALVNKEISRLVDGENVFWCDFNEQFLMPDGTLSPEFFFDLLHPTDRAYEVWFAAIRPYLDYALSDGALPVPPNRYAPFVRPEYYRTNEPQTVYPVSKIGDKDWADRFLRNRNQAAAAKGVIDLVFIGDATMFLWESRGADALKELRKSYSVLNLGYGGNECTENIVWRCENGELDGYRAKCVMVMYGADNGRDQPEGIAQGVRRILDIVAEKQPQAKILLIPAFPCGADAEDSGRKRHAKFNELIAKFADGQKVVLVDFNAKLVDANGDTQPFLYDRQHPTAETYRDVWLPAVRPIIKDIMGTGSTKRP